VKQRLFVLCSEYPDPEGSVSGGFVHTRCLQYQRRGIEVKVFVYHGAPRDYCFQGISVSVRPMTHIFEVIDSEKPDACAVHFPVRQFCDGFEKHQPPMPFGLWFHGVETLSWRRRLFDLNYGAGFFRYILGNTLQLNALRRFLEIFQRDQRIRLVYVSEWMHRIAQRDLNLRIPDFSIIPNPIDDEFFSYSPKRVEDRFEVLLLRSFGSRKYANDIAFDGLLKFAARRPDLFGKCNFRIFGKGRYFKPLVRKLGSFPNVVCAERFFEPRSLPEVHRTAGIFLCPTRQDAQGVSMCEAMASGLVPIASRNTAIPEFVIHNESGLLTSNSDEIADALETLSANPAVFARLSQGAAGHIRSLCAAQSVTSRELRVLDLGT
jgi:L-malate glycosyltransferase